MLLIKRYIIPNTIGLYFYLSNNILDNVTLHKIPLKASILATINSNTAQKDTKNNIDRHLLLKRVKSQRHMNKFKLS